MLQPSDSPAPDFVITIKVVWVVDLPLVLCNLLEQHAHMLTWRKGVVIFSKTMMISGLQLFKCVYL